METGSSTVASRPDDLSVIATVNDMAEVPNFGVTSTIVTRTCLAATTGPPNSIENQDTITFDSELDDLSDVEILATQPEILDVMASTSTSAPTIFEEQNAVTAESGTDDVVEVPYSGNRSLNVITILSKYSTNCAINSHNSNLLTN